MDNLLSSRNLAEYKMVIFNPCHILDGVQVINQVSRSREFQYSSLHLCTHILRNGKVEIPITRSSMFDHIHGGDTSWPKLFQNGGPQAIYETTHIEYRIVCCIETYLIHIYHMSKCSKCNWNRYIEGFCAFSHKWVIPKYCLCYLNELTFNGYLFSFIEFLTFFCAVFISYLMVINSKKYKSKYPNIIWWIMPCIMNKLWKSKCQ